MHFNFFFRKDKSMEYLSQICETADDVDDLQGMALYNCCHLDGLLELGTLVLTNIL